MPTPSLRLVAPPAPAALRRLPCSRACWLPSHRLAQRCRLLAVTARASGGGRQRRRPPPGSGEAGKLLKQYAAPALGLLVVGTLVGPLVGGLVMGALGLGVMVAASAAALSVSWIIVPFLVAIFGVPALLAGGMAAGVFATAAAGALLIPSLIQLVLVGGGLWLGASVAQRFFYGGGDNGEGGISPDGTIDVEARTVDDDWRDEMFKEKEDREAELREFDDLLRRRENFKRGGPPYS